MFDCRGFSLKQKWFLLNNHCISSQSFCPHLPFALILTFSDIMILIFHSLSVSLLVGWAGSRRFHQQRRAWHSSSKVCPGKRQLHTHLHLIGMPTGWASTSSYTHCYFWLAYNASITSLSLNRKEKTTISFVSKATIKTSGGARSKWLWQRMWHVWKQGNNNQLISLYKIR